MAQTHGNGKGKQSKKEKLYTTLAPFRVLVRSNCVVWSSWVRAVGKNKNTTRVLAKLTASLLGLLANVRPVWRERAIAYRTGAHVRVFPQRTTTTPLPPIHGERIYSHA